MMFSPFIRLTALLLLLLAIGNSSPVMAHSSHSHNQNNKDDSSTLKSKEDYLVQGLEEIVPAYKSFDGDMYAGLIPIHDPAESNSVRRQGEIMFWLFQPHSQQIPDTMTLWLNGGPGCSSFQCGNLYETGPVTTPLRQAGWCCGSENEAFAPNQYAWTNLTTMLYVEQPVGVGFSWGDEPVTEEDVSDDMVGFLYNFYQIFPELQSSEFYMFGESYAGMYVPAIAQGIYHANLQTDIHPPINLAGIGLGNGWIDVRIQGPAVIDYAYWHGMIDLPQRDAFREQWQRCLESSASPFHDDNTDNDFDTEMDDPYHVFTVPDECGLAGAVLEAAGKGIFGNTDKSLQPNTYDVTTWDPYPVIGGADTTTLQRFFNSPKVQTALNAPNVHWAGCIPGEGRRRLQQTMMGLGRRRRRTRRQLLQQQQQQQQPTRQLKSPPEIPPQGSLMLDQDRPLSMLPTIAELLDVAMIRVLVYNADLDMSVCAQGSEQALNEMEWSGQDEWLLADRGLWTTSSTIDKVAGYAKTTRNLSFVVVRNSGHMVPFNQPANGFDLIQRFLQGPSFIDEVLPRFAGTSNDDNGKHHHHQHHDDTSSSRQRPTYNDDDNTLSSNDNDQEEDSADWNTKPVHPFSRHVVIPIVLMFVGFAAGYATSHSHKKGYEALN